MMGRLVSFATLATFLVATFLLAASGARAEEEMFIDIRVPASYVLPRADSYACTTVQLPKDKSLKLVGVKPQADMAVVHHILLFGCLTPYVMPVEGQEPPAWDCGHQTICGDGG